MGQFILTYTITHCIRQSCREVRNSWQSTNTDHTPTETTQQCCKPHQLHSRPNQPETQQQSSGLVEHRQSNPLMTVARLTLVRASYNSHMLIGQDNTSQTRYANQLQGSLKPLTNSAASSKCRFTLMQTCQLVKTRKSISPRCHRGWVVECLPLPSRLTGLR